MRAGLSRNERSRRSDRAGCSRSCCRSGSSCSSRWSSSGSRGSCSSSRRRRDGHALRRGAGIMVIAAFVAGRTTVRGSTIGDVRRRGAGVAMLAGGSRSPWSPGGDEGEEPGPPVTVAAVVELVADIGFNRPTLDGRPPTSRSRSRSTTRSRACSTTSRSTTTPTLRNAGLRGRPRVRPGAGDLPRTRVPEGLLLLPLEMHPTTMTAKARRHRGRRRERRGGGRRAVAGTGRPPRMRSRVRHATLDLPPEALATITFDNRGRGNAAQHLDLLRTKARASPVPGRDVTGPARSRTRSGRSPRASTTSSATCIPT